MEQTQYLSCDKFVFYDTKIEEDDIWSATIYHKKVQENGNLGQRMQASFDFLFGLGYQKCIIIGSDLFDLTENIINKGYAALDAKETVLGPAEDGGYYLLGLKKMNPSLFENKEWGTETVLQDTLRNIDPNNLFLLETLNDIDTLEDLLKTNYVLK
jgi:rSAM/selenodomain-associated transferase 1